MTQQTPDGAEGGHDSREGGQGRTEIPPESVSSEDELSLSEEVERQKRKQADQ